VAPHVIPHVVTHHLKTFTTQPQIGSTGLKAVKIELGTSRCLFQTTPGREDGQVTHPSEREGGGKGLTLVMPPALQKGSPVWRLPAVFADLSH
jgi:hypothetical protein